MTGVIEAQRAMSISIFLSEVSIVVVVRVC